MSDLLEVPAAYCSPWLYFGHISANVYKYRIGNWEKHFAYYKYNTRKTEWQQVLPPDNFDKITLWNKNSIFYFPYVSWVSTVPPWLVHIINCFSFGHIFLLQLLRTRPLLSDMFKKTPAFFLIAVHLLSSLRVSPRQSASILTGRRKGILSQFKLPHCKSIVRILHKIKPVVFTRAEAEKIITVLNTPVICRFINNFREISGSYLSFLLQKKKQLHDFLLSDIFFNSICDNFSGFIIKKRIKYIKRLKRDTINILNELGETNEINKVQQIKKEKDLRSAHNHWLNIYLRITARQQINPDIEDDINIFPKPVLPGNNNIINLRSINQLKEEGITMHNCVGTYGRRVLNRQCDIYKVISPGRATLEIKLNSRGVRLGQLKGPWNRSVSKAVLNSVRNWFQTGKQKLEVDVTG
ncbi:MAG TPA: PcfJ domain-containing protein, partial [Spirochaetota bacterium]|nr:PcfJ domain-containing protein [Spirochaetota bacterium]